MVNAMQKIQEFLEITDSKVTSGSLKIESSGVHLNKMAESGAAHLLCSWNPTLTKSSEAYITLPGHSIFPRGLEKQTMFAQPRQEVASVNKV